jgi:membrane-associated phospholipid phosphatase
MKLVPFARRVGRTLLAICALPVATLSGQIAAPADTTKRPDNTTKRPEKLFTPKDAALLVGFAGATLAMYPVDKSMAQRLQNENSFASKSINQWANGFDYLAWPGVFVMSAGSYAVGKLTSHPDMADFGWHTTEAIIVGAGLTEVLKGTIGRSRPFVSADTNPRDFKFGAGWSNDDRRSFPSGHATIAFSAASAATSEVQRLWPKYTWVAGTVFYGSATMVGLARMYQNQHWASDVALGAGIGTFAGLKTVRYTHIHPNSYLDRILLGTTIAPDGRGGALVSWSTPIR